MVEKKMIYTTSKYLFDEKYEIITQYNVILVRNDSFPIAFSVVFSELPRYVNSCISEADQSNSLTPCH